MRGRLMLVVDHPEPFIVILDGVIEDCLPRVGNAFLVLGKNDDGGVTGFPIRFSAMGSHGLTRRVRPLEQVLRTDATRIRTENPYVRNLVRISFEPIPCISI